MPRAGAVHGGQLGEPFDTELACTHAADVHERIYGGKMDLAKLIAAVAMIDPLAHD